MIVYRNVSFHGPFIEYELFDWTLILGPPCLPAPDSLSSTIFLFIFFSSHNALTTDYALPTKCTIVMISHLVTSISLDPTP